MKMYGACGIPWKFHRVCVLNLLSFQICSPTNCPLVWNHYFSAWPTVLWILNCKKHTLWQWLLVFTMPLFISVCKRTRIHTVMAIVIVHSLGHGNLFSWMLDQYLCDSFHHVQHSYHCCSARINSHEICLIHPAVWHDCCYLCIHLHWVSTFANVGRALCVTYWNTYPLDNSSYNLVFFSVECIQSLQPMLIASAMWTE